MPAQPDNPKAYLQAVVTHCCQEAESAQKRLAEVVDCLRQGNHLGAAGAFDGLEDSIHYIGVVLKRAARVSRTAI